VSVTSAKVYSMFFTVCRVFFEGAYSIQSASMDAFDWDLDRPTNKYTFEVKLKWSRPEDALPKVPEVNSDIRLIRDLETELKEPSFADWTLICQGKKVPCHRFLLAARSRSFKAFFKKSSAEETVTELKDLDLETLYAMLEYVYTDRVDEEKPELLFKLFNAAVLYMMDGLQVSILLILHFGLHKCITV
jgi:hypothetical protein